LCWLGFLDSYVRHVTRPALANNHGPLTGGRPLAGRDVGFAPVSFPPPPFFVCLQVEGLIVTARKKIKSRGFSTQKIGVLSLHPPRLVRNSWGLIFKFSILVLSRAKCKWRIFSGGAKNPDVFPSSRSEGCRMRVATLLAYGWPLWGYGALGLNETAPLGSQHQKPCGTRLRFCASEPEGGKTNNSPHEFQGRSSSGHSYRVLGGEGTLTTKCTKPRFRQENNALGFHERNQQEENNVGPLILL